MKCATVKFKVFFLLLFDPNFEIIFLIINDFEINAYPLFVVESRYKVLLVLSLPFGYGF